MNDLFKPLYKQHRRANEASLAGVFDPRCGEPVCDLGNYRLVNAQNRWTCEQLPGLLVLPGALSLAHQASLVRECTGEYLENSEHRTNLDAHYDLERPLRMFTTDHGEQSVLPDANLTPVANKIRWVTLGGQYNWTTKEYPSFTPGTPGCPVFPTSLATFVKENFGITAEAAIVNFYTDGDILSPHRDVAELGSHDLVSISLGCACVFYIGIERHDSAPLPMLLRSGDIVVMGGRSRHAFHGVGRVFGSTSPPELMDASTNLDTEFRDWMKSHRININVRQMR